MAADALRRRYLCLWMPFLSADCWRRKSQCDEIRPIVFVDKAKGVSRLAAVDARARSLGLHVGMALADARARLTGLRVITYNPPARAAFVENLANLAMAFTPSVALDPPDGLALDITGCSHLFAGEAVLAARLKNVLRTAGVSEVRLAIATTPDMARALARFGRETLSLVDDDKLVRSLPVAALECGQEDTMALRRAGLKTIADIANRPSVLFTARFTAAFSEKLARVLGEHDNRITPLRTPPPCIAERRCADPVASQDVISLILTELATHVSKKLQTRCEGGRAFVATFMRSDGVIFRVRVKTSLPTRDPAVIMRLYKDRLDTLADPLDPGFGFDFIRFEAVTTEPYVENQITIDELEQRNDKLVHLVDRLSIIFGHERVKRLQPVDSHIPEKAQAIVPATTTEVSNAWARYSSVLEIGSRPPLIFARPHPIKVESTDEVPVSLHWRRVSHCLAHAVGPERISEEWWRTPSSYGTRDYYRVESTNGFRFWIFCTAATERNSCKWFLHGIFP